MDKYTLSELVGKVCIFTDMWGEGVLVIPVRRQPDVGADWSKGIDGYSMSLLQRYGDNKIGDRIRVFEHDKLRVI